MGAARQGRRSSSSCTARTASSREQAELLRTQLAAAPSGEFTAELGQRLSAVEEQVGILAQWALKEKDSAEAMGALEQRIGELRTAIDTLRPTD